MKTTLDSVFREVFCMNRWMKAGAAVLALGLLASLSGCGGEKQAASSKAAAPAKKELKVACVATYPPFV